MFRVICVNQLPNNDFKIVVYGSLRALRASCLSSPVQLGNYVDPDDRHLVIKLVTNHSVTTYNYTGSDCLSDVVLPFVSCDSYSTILLQIEWAIHSSIVDKIAVERR